MNQTRRDPRAEQEAIVDEFNLFPDWLDRYQYLIDLGKKLPPLSEAEKSDEFLLHGCQSNVWLHINGNGEALELRANSDAAIVSGLIALLIRVYSGARPQEILDNEPFFIEAIGLKQHLSATRANGLAAMLQAIRNAAKAAAA